MPELPEVESARSMLERCCKGIKIRKAVLKEQGGGPRTGKFDDIIVDDDVPMQTLKKALEGRTFVEICRKGKQLYFIHDKPPHSLWHFGMTGFFYVEGDVPPAYKRFSPDLATWPPRFCKVELQFENGVKLAFCDPRRLGRIKLRDDPLVQDPLSLLAPDPVLSPLPFETFLEKMRKITAPVKAVLLDQNRIVCGVGNWIADEVCFQAKIHPSAPCNTLSDCQLKLLLECIGNVCRSAVEVDAQSDKFPSGWLFHYRWNKGAGPTKMPDGKRIHFETVGGRTTAIVEGVQRMGELKSVSSTSNKKRKRNHVKEKGVKISKKPKAQVVASTELKLAKEKQSKLTKARASESKKGKLKNKGSQNKSKEASITRRGTVNEEKLQTPQPTKTHGKKEKAKGFSISPPKASRRSKRIASKKVKNALL
mmetsp:Transcript_38747/g.51054  ORF Transcript_38747/g.51054 Transcript_38747/m.51054 type:complete len:422 (+) Transcript_38747:53-1318(+)